MASHSQGSKSAPPIISSNFGSTPARPRSDGAGAPPRSFADALGRTTSFPPTYAQQQQQQQQQQLQHPVARSIDFATTSDRDRFLVDNPLSAYVAVGPQSVSFPAKMRVGDLHSPPVSARSAQPAPGSMTKATSLELESALRAEIAKEHADKYAALLHDSAARDIAIALQNSSDQAALIADLRNAQTKYEAMECKFAELESKVQQYPDNMSDTVPPSVHSLAPSYPSNKLLQSAIPLDVILSVCSEPSNSYPYGDSNSSGMLRSRLMKDAKHFPTQGMQFYFHVLSILPITLNKYVAAQALADASLKQDPSRLIEFLCYRFSHGFIKSLTSLRAVLPKTVADQAQFMTALAKLDLDGLYGPRLGRLYPAFFIRMGILGVDVAAPDVDFSSLSSGTFTDASFTVVTLRVFAWTRFTDELAFADQLAAFVLSGVFTPSTSLHAISGSRSSAPPSYSSRDRESRPDSRSRAREASSDDKLVSRERESGERGRGGRGRRSFSRSRFSSFRQFTFGPKKERMCHSFF